MECESLILDYAEAVASKRARKDLLGNLSGVCVAGDDLWTVSDEGRTIERLTPNGDGYRLRSQARLDELFPGLPAGEADLESIDCDGEQLWICGSHCRVRRKTDDGGIDEHIDARPSRHLFGTVKLAPDGGAEPPGRRLPFQGKGDLRRMLGSSKVLAPFLEIPSKEGGLDIEGLAMAGGSAFLGLRGPVIDSFAVVAEVGVNQRAALVAAPPRLHFVDLGGLAVRDLARLDGDLLILAGPTDALNGPFRIHRWRPRATRMVQSAEALWDFPAGSEHPEGLCALQRSGRPGLLVLHDSPAPERISGTTYRADWLALPA